ncbi:glycosyltransferase family 4 protein [Haloarcula onubensis]|uniref:Glycosyltransferase family 4 protein n=1 Tax=Haloarcula onubensis TaxID=2950539 RepID=A0ABU2FPT7_9EURY|nr:glycosyltransferase family 4 protein [Halomicroarcula sp. S3CR25-11]MDS0282277.1 glycosyltransferase family 4 protein [Halomicroarcula sp. S3CR25-11]
MSGKERICFVLTSAYGYFEPSVEAVGGGARQLSFISRELTDTFDVHFVVGDYGQPRTEQVDGVTLHRAYSPSPDTSPLRKPLQLLKLLRAMRAANADIYVYRGRPYQAAIIYALTRLLDGKWVYNLANDPNIGEQPAALSPWMRKLFVRALHDATTVITQTNGQATKLQAEYGIQSTVIPSGYPEADDISGHDEREYVLWVGRLDPKQKRPHLYLDLAAACPDVSFVMIGPEGQDEQYNQRIADRVRELENLDYLGSVDPAHIHEYYREAIALVSTAAFEGFPSTFLEAWRYETPVVSLDVKVSRFANLSEYEGDADGDFETLVELTRLLVSSPAARSRLSQPTSDHFTENLTLAQVVSQYRSTLERALAA